jgi:hypothetical protein
MFVLKVGADQVALWPELPFEAWADTRRALHMMTQIVGKVKLDLAPKQPHWWHSTLRVTPAG